MKNSVGIRREDKNVWERRVPLTPQHVGQLAEEIGGTFCVQPSDIRAFSDQDYAAVGAHVREDLSGCSVVLAVKEIPVPFLQPGTTYVFFAHVIKGQPSNMPMLQRMLDLKCTLIDYEKVTDDLGRRLIFFGRHAGLAGMIDTLWAYGQRMSWEGVQTPFAQIHQAYHYPDAAAAKLAVQRVGEQIAAGNLAESIAPFVCGFAGYGNVSRGAQEIYDQLPLEEVSPTELAGLSEDCDRKVVYKVVFKEQDTVKPRDPTQPFDLADFFQHPSHYESQFERYLPHLDILVNAIYWTPVSPRLVTKAHLAQQYREGGLSKLKVIGDMSCDVEGAIEATVRATEPDNPIYVYEPLTSQALDGVAGNGPVIMAVDNLPCELPAESSADFSQVLKAFVPAIAAADYAVPFEALALPPEIKRAVITHQGELTPRYQYLEKHLA